MKSFQSFRESFQSFQGFASQVVPGPKAFKAWPPERLPGPPLGLCWLGLLRRRFAFKSFQRRLKSLWISARLRHQVVPGQVVPGDVAPLSDASGSSLHDPTHTATLGEMKSASAA